MQSFKMYFSHINIIMVTVIFLIYNADFANPCYKDYTYLKKYKAFYKIFHNESSINDASNICISDGAEMFLPETEDEIKDVWSNLNHNNETILYAITDRLNEGQFVPLKEESMSNFYVKWNVGEPNNAGGDEDCVTSIGPTLYNDVPCDRIYKFICKRIDPISSIEEKKSDEHSYKDYTYLKKYNAFYKKFPDVATIDEASATCTSDGAEMFLAETEDEIKDVWSNLNKNSETIIYAITDRLNEGKFVPLKESMIDFYIKWPGGEPNDYGGNEDCVTSSGDIMYNDVPCTMKYKFVCKKIIPISFFEKKEYHYVPILKKKYKLYLTKKKWHDALIACNNDGAHLTVINNYNERDYLKDMMKTYSETYHENIEYALSGFHDIKDKGKFVTVTGQKFNENMKWKNDKKIGGDDENCGSFTSDGQLSVISCNKIEYFICEIQDLDYMTNTCEKIQNDNDGYVENSALRVLYKFHETPRIWNDARRVCKMENATLAMPKNKAEADEILNIFHSGVKDESKNIIIGFHDLFNNGEYVIENGDSLQFYYHEWNEDRSKDSKNENCGGFNRLGKLNEISCSIPYPFVCQIRTLPYRLYNSLRTCISDSDYIYGKDLLHSYKLHLNPQPWGMARLICASEGGSLAVINNINERNFLIEILNKTENKPLHPVEYPNNVLLGFHDLFEEGHYTAITGEELDKSGFFIWENTKRGDLKKNCGSMTLNGSLEDFPCSVPAIFFCEISNWNDI